MLLEILINFFDMIHGRRHILEQKISKGNSGHGFYNDNRAGNDNGVMPSVDGDLGIFPVFIYGFLKLCDRGGRFYGGPDDQT